MMMASVASGRGGLHGLQIGFQTGKGRLRARQIVGLQGDNQTLIGRVGLAVAAKRWTGRSLRIALQILLENGQRGLRAGNIAGLQGAAEGSEILDDLGKTARVRTRVRARIRIDRRRHAGNGAHISALFKLH